MRKTIVARLLTMRFVLAAAFACFMVIAGVAVFPSGFDGQVYANEDQNLSEEIQYQDLFYYQLRESGLHITRVVKDKHYNSEGKLDHEDSCKITSLRFPDTLTVEGKSYPVEYIDDYGRWDETGHKDWSGAFENCINLTEIVFPKHLKKIGDHAFMGCVSLTEVNLPDGLEYLGSSAFQKCTSLTSVYIPAGVKCQNGGTAFGPFAGDSNLTNVTFGEGIQTISQGLFEDTGLKHITIPDSVTMIEDRGFSRTNDLKSVSFSGKSQLKEIGTWAFQQSGITEISLPDSLTTISSLAFCYCKSLKRLKIPGNAEATGSGAFVGCDALEEIEFTEGTNQIGDYLFSESPIRSITIPASVTRIGWKAFCDCSSLKEIYFEGLRPDGGFPPFEGVTANVYFDTWDQIPTSWGGDLTFIGNVDSTQGRVGSYYKVYFKSSDKVAKTLHKSIQVETGKPYGVLPKAKPKSSKYYFKGWYTKKNGKGKKVTKMSIFTLSKNQTLYAAFAKRISISKAKVTVKTVTYNGSKLKPAVIVKLNGKTLTKGTHYKVTYTNNLNASKKAVAKITGKGKYIGSKSQKFTIKKAKQSFLLNGKALKTSTADIRFGPKNKGSVKSLNIKPRFGKAMKLKKNSGSGITITDQTKAKVKLKDFGTAKITIMTKGTKNYSAGTLKAYVSLQRDQTIKLSSKQLKYNKNTKKYVLDKIEMKPISLTISVKGDVRYSATVTNKDGAKSRLVGNQLTVIRPGTIILTVKTEDTRKYVSKKQSFTIDANGLKDLYQKSGDWVYLVDTDGKIILEKYSGSDTSVTIPAYITDETYGKRPVKKLAEYAFSDSDVEVKETIKSVDFAAGEIVSVGESAFEGCTALETVWLPLSLKSIGEKAFLGCSSLNSINLPDGITKISSNAFDGCKALTNVILPINTTSIGKNAYKGCTQLRKITIPATLKTVEDGAFAGDNSLKHLYYGSNLAKWKTVTVGSNNGCLTNAAFHSYGDGKAPSSNISDATLFDSYPSNLQDSSFFHMADTVQGSMAETMCSMTSDQDLRVAIRHCMLNVGTGNIEDIISWVTGFQNVEEKKAYQELALELLKETLQAIDYQEEFDESETMGIYDIFEEVYDAADVPAGLVFKDAEERYRFAQKLAPYFEGTSASQINNILKMFEEKWGTVSSIVNRTDHVISAADYMCTFFTIKKMQSETIGWLTTLVPENTKLRQGMEDVRDTVELSGMERDAVIFLEENTIKEVAKCVTAYLKKEADGYFGGHKFMDASMYMFIAESMYHFTGYCIDAPSLDDYVRSLMMMCNTAEMRMAVNDLLLSDEVDQMEFEGTMKLYLACLNQWSPYVVRTLDEFEDHPYGGAYLKQIINRYDDILTYRNYLNTCKYHINNQ